ncbi:MAG: DNA-3-methyladenine glycosylase 2 family protein [Ruminococcus sp.]|jgi:N-glycosylase/DNA lyase|nr:DNA-3-methyladenine glycosylase 2 family protein [Ruminococcus sp.]
MREFEVHGTDIYVCCKGFDLELTLDCGQSFRRIVNAEQKADGVVILHDITEEEFLSKWDDYFDFKLDYEAVKAEFEADPTMKKAIDFCGGIHILKQDPWEALISFIISQNNNIPRIKLIIERLITHFSRFPTAEDLLTDISFARLGFREKYLKSAAENILSGRVNLEEIDKMTITNSRQALMKISGVGPKVAECTLLYGFHRLEAFPRDVWINRALDEFYPNGFPYIDSKYAGIAQQYLFHYIRNIKNA